MKLLVSLALILVPLLVLLWAQTRMLEAPDTVKATFNVDGRLEPSDSSEVLADLSIRRVSVQLDSTSPEPNLEPLDTNAALDLGGLGPSRLKEKDSLEDRDRKTLVDALDALENRELWPRSRLELADEIVRASIASVLDASNRYESMLSRERTSTTIIASAILPASNDENFMLRDYRIYRFADSEFPAFRLVQEQLEHLKSNPAKLDDNSVNKAVAYAVALGNSALQSLPPTPLQEQESQ